MKAFTLVETLVAISIITIVILGPFSLFITNVTNAEYIRDELTASSLAQEGVEYVYFVRDSNYLLARKTSATLTDFLEGLDGNPSGANCVANTCTIDPTAAVGASLPITASTIAQCSGTCAPLYIRPDYTYTQQSSGNTLSRFTRSLSLCYMNGAVCNSTVSNEARVTVTVSWSTQGQSHSLSVVDYLQNWVK